VVALRLLTHRSRLVFDLVAFHDKMRRLLVERQRGNITPERAETEERKNEEFGSKFENQIADMYQDLQSVKPSDLKADPTGEGLRRPENSYEPPLPHPLKATVVRKLSSAVVRASR
jgi:hypothetical protein